MFIMTIGWTDTTPVQAPLRHCPHRRSHGISLVEPRPSLVVLLFASGVTVPTRALRQEAQLNARERRRDLLSEARGP